MYRQLDHSKIISTLEVIHNRITERFPEAGLGKVSQELLMIGKEAEDRCKWIARPFWALRAFVYTVIVAIIVSFVFVLQHFDTTQNNLTLGEFIQILEAAINDVVYIGAAILFLTTVEGRMKRRRVLQLIHELRSMAHVIDMHQLNKDPDIVLMHHHHDDDDDERGPQLTMSPLDLERYLDYCSELLSVMGKIAALYVQDFDDSQAVESVNEIETLTNGLSRKIWQKISILHAYQ